MPITGTHLVRALRSALRDARRLWPNVGDFMELRRHALKLRFWGERHDQTGTVLDLDFEAIRALPGSGVHELRIADAIGGVRNIRVLFLVPPDDWRPTFRSERPVLWVLEALAKKRQEWTAFDLKRFDAKRAIVRERFYL